MQQGCTIGKNIKRDYTKWATAAIIEMQIVKSYRAEMLKALPAASHLRTALQHVLTTYAPSKRIVDHKTKMNKVTRQFIYPDGIAFPQLATPPMVDVQRLVLTREQWVASAADRKEMQDIITFVEKKSLTSSVPGGSYMSSDVYDKLSALIWVCSPI